MGQEFGSSDLDAYELHTPRSINFEDALARQLDRIAFRRSNGLAWDEALYQLRDMVVGFEDEQFWDGIPPKERERIKGLENPRDQNEEAEVWQEDGWSTMHVRAFRVAGGRIIFRPTTEQMSRQLRIVLRLMDRCGMRRKTRQQSRLPDELTRPDDD